MLPLLAMRGQERATLDIVTDSENAPGKMMAMAESAAMICKELSR